MGKMFLVEPSASVTSGFFTQILSSLILKSSILCGMMVGTISLFSSTILWSSLSMNSLKKSTSEATGDCSLKYFWISTFPFLYIDDHPIECCLACGLALPQDLDHISRLCVQ